LCENIEGKSCLYVVHISKAIPRHTFSRSKLVVTDPKDRLGADYRGWTCPSRADLSIILGPVVPFRRTQHALFDVIHGTAHEVYESKHSKHLRHRFEINIYQNK